MPEITQLRPALKRLPRLPDLITTANLVCGVASILLASQGQLTIACWLIFLAALFDVFDGLAARALGGGTPLGTQLDSMADMVSFGVAPAYAVWVLSAPALQADLLLIGAAVICICIASAWRLAKFNVDTRQSTGFLGLATPANGLFWVSVVLIGVGSGLPDNTVAHSLASLANLAFANSTSVFIVALLLGILMLSELPLPSLKFKSKGWKGNEVIFLLTGLGVVFVLLYGILAVPLLLILYVLSPLWGKAFG